MVSLDRPAAAVAAGERALALALDLDCRDAKSQSRLALAAAYTALGDPITAHALSREAQTLLAAGSPDDKDAPHQDA